MKTALDSEDAILAVIDRHFPNTHPALVLGRGDDCAELAPPSSLRPLPVALSSDLFIEHIHFRRSYFSLREIGHKALAVNLSDLGAAGAAPAGFSLCLMLPPGFSAEEAEELFGGMAELAKTFNIPLTGGDLSLGPDKKSLGFSITIWGYPANPDTPWAQQAPFLRRGQARPGDLIFVAQEKPGPLHLGLARCGLLALEALGPAAKQTFPQACAAHLMPRPLINEGLALARFRAEMEQARPGSAAQMRLALMDVSDGLARDLPRLLDGGARKPFPAQTGAGQNEDNAGPGRAREILGASLRLPVEQLHPELAAFAQNNPDKAGTNRNGSAAEPRILGLALAGGEDYCLLGSCAPEYFTELQTKLPALYLIGEARAEKGIFCNSINIAEYVGGGGFDHFTPA